MIHQTGSVFTNNAASSVSKLKEQAELSHSEPLQSLPTDTASISGRIDSGAPEKPSPAVRREFTDYEAEKALKYFMDFGMEGSSQSGVFKKSLFFYSKVSSPADALTFLKRKTPLYVKNEEGKYTKISNLSDLQELDSLKGRGENTILPDNQFFALKFLEKGVDGNDGFYTRGFVSKDKKLNAYETLQQFKQGYVVEVNIDDKDGKVARSMDDLVELNRFYGAGVDDILPSSQFDSMKFFDKLEGDEGYLISDGKKGVKKGDAYDALQEMQRGKQVVIKQGKREEVVKSPEDVQELDALTGRRENTILPNEQYHSLLDLEDGFSRHQKLSAYEALQHLQAGETIRYSFRGGDFSQTLMLPVKALEDLPETRLKVVNQQEFDKYRFPFPEYRKKHEKLLEKTPDELKKALDNAQSDMRRAKAMPMQVQETYTTTEYNYHYGYNPSTGKYEMHYGPQTVTKTRWVHNQERDRKIYQAKEKIGSGEKVESAMPELRKLTREMSEENFQEKKDDLKDLLRKLEREANNCDGTALSMGFKKMSSLIKVMEERPERPAGWTAPRPRVEGD